MQQKNNAVQYASGWVESHCKCIEIGPEWLFRPPSVTFLHTTPLELEEARVSQQVRHDQQWLAFLI